MRVREAPFESGAHRVNDNFLLALPMGNLWEKMASGIDQGGDSRRRFHGKPHSARIAPSGQYLLGEQTIAASYALRCLQGPFKAANGPLG